MDITDNTLDFNKVCRLCLTEETVMSSIYNEQDTETNSVPLPLRIMACVSVEISSNDGLPSQICATCLCQVDGWYKFKDLCENSDLILRKCIKNEPVQIDTITQVKSMAQEVKKYFSSQVKEESEAANQNKILSPKKKMMKRIKTSRMKKNQQSKEEEAQNNKIDEEKDESLNSPPWGFDDHFMLDNDETNVKNLDLTGEAEKEKLEEMDGAVKKKRKLNYFDVTYDHPVPTKDGKVHQCRICRKYLKNVTTRNRHEIEKHPPPLPCEFCQKTFTTVLTYHTHRNIHLGLTKFKCKFCGKYLASRSNLEDHEKVHTKERPVECPQCDKTFSSTSNLRVHLKFHAGVKTYFCHVCGKGHVTIGNLKLHVKRHSNERSHVCHICGKGFNGKSELNKHIESHNNEKKYSCQYCLQKLKTPNSLRRHINIQHLKLRPFKCDVCLRDFGRRENLKEHMQVHSVKKEFCCHVCSRQFTHVRYLKKHKCE